MLLFADCEESFGCGFVFCTDALEDHLTQLFILDQFRIARGYGEARLGQDHVHVGQLRLEEGPALIHLPQVLKTVVGMVIQVVLDSGTEAIPARQPSNDIATS